MPPEWANGNFSDTSPERLHSQSVGCVMSPRDVADLEWPLSEGMQVSALPPVWIAMIISCWKDKLLKLPSVTLTHVCGTNSHNWWAKGMRRVGVVKIFYDSDSSGWKTFRLRLLDSDSTNLVDDKDKILRYVFNKCHINFLIHMLYKHDCCERENKVSIVKILQKNFKRLCGS